MMEFSRRESAAVEDAAAGLVAVALAIFAAATLYGEKQHALKRESALEKTIAETCARRIAAHARTRTQRIQILVSFSQLPRRFASPMTREKIHADLDLFELRLDRKCGRHRSPARGVDGGTKARESSAAPTFNSAFLKAGGFTTWNTLGSEVADSSRDWERKSDSTVSHSEDHNNAVIVVWYWDDFTASAHLPPCPPADAETVRANSARCQRVVGGARYEAVD